MKGETDIFSFLNYRDYLSRRMVELKQTDKLSLRGFVKRAGVKAPGFVKLIIDGKRNLAPETAKRFARALKLEGNAREYFSVLVTYNQEEDPDTKMRCFEELVRLRPRSAEFMHDKWEDRYYSRYHYVCIREMAVLADFREDAEWIARRCYPEITPTQAREALQTLIKLGMLVRNENGRLVASDRLGNERDHNLQSVALYHFHEAVLDKTRHALGELQQHERHYHANTFAMPKKLMADVVQEYLRFHDRVAEIIDKSGLAGDDVFQMNFQLFPVTKVVEDK